jgi:small subunit ribosomal protein S10e
MLIPTKDRKTIYQHLFQEGVMVAKKDFNAPKHQDIDVSNLYVIKALQSLASREYVKVQFSWLYYYYFLTDKGFEYLREYLQLPQEIVPKTHIKTQRSVPRGNFRGDRRDNENRGQRDEYRRRDKEGASGNFQPSFRGGAGRGRAQNQQ